MTASGFDGIEFHPSHTIDNGQKLWVWVAVDDHDGRRRAIAIVVGYQPAPDIPHVYDRCAYTVLAARNRGIGTRLARHALDALQNQQPPITFRLSAIATQAGYGLSQRLGIEPSPDTARQLAEAGREYNNFDQAQADEYGLAALRAAAQRLKLPRPEP
ncbi:hypothetical protein [Nocardia brasiliensis]|uniref:hypothetical protein n=1 Tax=Nocardia brasiliensis TaxID=37326 RepID=UPI002458C349|nr:hypothetical protein [Nocardia brasiliensis]